MKRFGLEPSRDKQVGGFLNQIVRRIARLEGSHPRSRVQLVLHMSVAMARAAHERRTANDPAARALGNDFFAAEPVLRGKDGRAIEEGADRSDGLFHLRRFTGNNREIAGWKILWPRRSLQSGFEFVLAADAETFAIQ